ncbi:hypothetical protein MCOR29_007375 [Pyricularia oryzae]|nr:hypothetical protein MCOR01_010384 [Pyricularia oryzae]KAI6284227.1 hypothetical protein MCOR26_002080 [Pyricularia oryzae]KAI6311570.1 hypothetical protein MCOR34_005977 [Pyricularia oryzae]KAI6314451.1 hypothetical protein MCOR29_007375 [Pyricularia oryzae]KAI6345466.1 hypothetical protein MCOR28_003536 [Pyricularia oryzae]
MQKLPEPAIHGSANRTPGGNNAFYNIANDYTHIADLNLRRRLALADIDRIPLGLQHARAVAVAGVGFFLDSYDIFAIDLIVSLLGVVFWQGGQDQAANGFGGNGGRLPSTVDQALKASTSAGIIIGQLIFGCLADAFGRRKMYGIELCIVLVSTLCFALASPSSSISSTGILVFWRLMMGVGIGGDYPLSSVITSEFAPTRWRGAMLAAMFSMQGIGQLIAAVTTLVVTVIFKESFIDVGKASECDATCRLAADRSWRLIVGIGALPACFAMYYRITIPETPRYTLDVAQDIEKAEADVKAYMCSQPEGTVDPLARARAKRLASISLDIPSASWPDVYSYFRQWRHLKILIGTTVPWFSLDLAFYGLGLNTTVVLKLIGYSRHENFYHTLYDNAVGMIILTCAGSLPGYWMSVLTIDTFGRRPIQILGFLVLTILFCILGFAYHHLSGGSMLALYIAAQFFFNFGPNTTTFITPAEVFPTRYRATGHGVSAAMGKIGAILAQGISIPLLERDRPPTASASCEGLACSRSLPKLMLIFAVFMLIGTLTSTLVPETKGATLEELAGELSDSGGGRGGPGPGMGKPSPRGGKGGGDGGVDKGSAGMGSRARRWLQKPFPGGKPAGFQRALARASPRVGIMAGPDVDCREALSRQRMIQSSSGRGFRGPLRGWPFSDDATNSTQEFAGGRTGGKRSRGKSKTKKGAVESGGGGGEMVSDGLTATTGDETDHNDRFAFVGEDAAAMQVLASTHYLAPGWGAGWGRMDRGGRSASKDNMLLQDVGSLLR